MIAADDPLVRVDRAGNARHNVIRGLHVPVEGELEMDFGRARAEAVRDRKSAPPPLRRRRSTHGGENGLGIAIRDGQRRDFGEHRGGLRNREARSVLGRTGARRQRVTGIDGQIHDAAALHSVFGTVRALRINFAGEVAVVARIGINNAADCSVLGGDLRLYPAKVRTITDDDDRALYGNS